MRSDPIRFANVAGRDVGDGASPVTLSDYINTQFDPALSWNDVDWLRSVWDGPIVLKGVQTVDDAVLAAERGVDAIALSNHGGRQLDGAPAAFSLVAPVADAVGGRTEIICDGGMRRGSDIVKAVAAGATASMAGSCLPLRAGRRRRAWRRSGPRVVRRRPRPHVEPPRRQHHRRPRPHLAAPAPRRLVTTDPPGMAVSCLDTRGARWTQRSCWPRPASRPGLSDFGDDSFREGLDRLVHSIETEATLNELGQVALPFLITRLLTTRLQVEDWYRRHPEIDDEPIDAPLIGLGLPRTGSTALSFLLAEDPAARSLRLWESNQPCPPPSTVEPPDPRIAEAQAGLAVQEEMNPRLAALVPAEATGPMECQELMALDFRAHYFPAFAHLPSYTEWLLDADLTSTYRYERRVLKLLQWGEPEARRRRPWRLKCPSHLLWLDDLAEVFPEARFVMTHRDPTDVMVSVADVYCEVGRQFSDGIDPHYLGRLNVEQWTTGMDRVLAFRDAHGDDRFYDIDFRAMQRDPVGEVRGALRLAR